MDRRVTLSLQDAAAGDDDGGDNLAHILGQVAAFGAPPFVAAVHAQTLLCRAQHHCIALPFEAAPFLGVLAAAVAQGGRILELGCALGYSTLWLAHGAKRAVIDAIDNDPLHCAAARLNFERYGIADRVRLYEAAFEAVLPDLKPGYDLAFYDGGAPELDLVPDLHRLVRPGGVVICSSLASSAALFTAAWHSAPFGGHIVMSVRL